jgi:hypothetical protein
MNRIPNPSQAHSSLSTTGTASTLAQLGFTRHVATDSVLIQSVGGDVRMTLNGTNPTASLGILISDGTAILLDEVEVGAARFITGSGSPKLEIASYVK